MMNTIGASDNVDDATQECDVTGVCGCVYCRIQEHGIPNTVDETTRQKIEWEMAQLIPPVGVRSIERQRRVFVGCIKGPLAQWKGPRQFHYLQCFSGGGHKQPIVRPPSDESLDLLDSTCQTTLPAPQVYIQSETNEEGVISFEFDAEATATGAQEPFTLWKGGFWHGFAPSVPWQTMYFEYYHYV